MFSKVYTKMKSTNHNWNVDVFKEPVFKIDEYIICLLDCSATLFEMSSYSTY